MLRGSDRLSLPPGFEHQPGVLYDHVLDVWHTIHPPGMYIMTALAQGVSFNDLLCVAKTHGITADQLYELLSGLHDIGALRRGRSIPSHIQAGIVQTSHFLHGIRYAPYVWRATAQPGTLAIALLRASWPLLGASSIVGLAAVSSGLQPVGTVLSALGNTLALFGLSLYTHELAHVAFIRQHQPAVVVLQRGLRMGLVHRPLSRRWEIATAFAGPATGLATCCLVAYTYLLLDRHTMLGLCLLVGSFHICSLLPWYGDGATIIRALSKE